MYGALLFLHMLLLVQLGLKDFYVYITQQDAPHKDKIVL
jgi:hypothetical protein